MFPLLFLVCARPAVHPCRTSSDLLSGPATALAFNLIAKAAIPLPACCSPGLMRARFTSLIHMH